MVRRHIRLNTNIFELAVHLSTLQNPKDLNLRRYRYLFRITKNTADNDLWVFLRSHDYADVVLLRGDHFEGHCMLQFCVQGHDITWHRIGTGPGLLDHILFSSWLIYNRCVDTSLDKHSPTWLWDRNIQLSLVHPRRDRHDLISAYTDECKEA